jgi:hypothetical protein
MTRRKKRPPRALRNRAGTHHVYPEGWRPGDWYVPFEDGEHACMHHGHDTAPDDHSLCGPSIFCCRKAAERYIALLPGSNEARAEWELTEGSHIATWTRPSDRGLGVQVLYFVFCDPARPGGLLAIGLHRSTAGPVLSRRVPLDRYAADAERLC